MLTGASAPELFPDVPAGFWSGTAIEACVTNGVLQGYLDGCYHPEYIVTRDQMAVYVARAFEQLRSLERQMYRKALTRFDVMRLVAS